MEPYTLSNGTTINIEPGVTHEDVLRYLKDRSPEDYRVALDDLKAGPALKPTSTESLGRGFYDLYAGTRQMLPEAAGGFSPQQNAEELAEAELYERGAGPGIDWPRLGGQALGIAGGAIGATHAPLLAGKAALTGAAGLLGQAGAGAVGSGLLFAKSPGERGVNAALGALGGAAGRAVSPLASKVAAPVARGARSAMQRLSGRKPNVGLTSAGDALEQAYRPQVDAALAGAPRAGVEASPEIAERVAMANRMGMTGPRGLTRGQTYRNPLQYTQEVEMAKTAPGAALQGRFAAQRRGLVEGAEGLQRRIGGEGGEAVTRDSAGDVIEKSVTDSAKAAQEEVSEIYRAFSEADPDFVFSPEGLRSSIMRQFDDVGGISGFEDALPTRVTDRLGELFDPKNARAMTPEELHKLDKLVTETMSGEPSAAMRSAGHRVKEGIRTMMSEEAEKVGGAYRKAVGAAQARFDRIGPKTKIVGKTVNPLVEIDPREFAAKLQTGTLKDIRRIKDMASPDAWRQGATTMINEITETATDGERFMMAAFGKKIRKIGKERLELALGKEATDELFNLHAMAEHLFKAPPDAAINRSNTSSALVNVASKVKASVLRFIDPTGAAEGAASIAGEVADTAGRKVRRASKEALQAIPTPLPRIGAGAPAGLLAVEAARSKRREQGLR